MRIEIIGAMFNRESGILERTRDRHNSRVDIAGHSSGIQSFMECSKAESLEAALERGSSVNREATSKEQLGVQQTVGAVYDRAVFR